MALTSGETLPTYRISGLLGKGGMGEVYVLNWLDELKARAPRLFRTTPEHAPPPGRDRLLATIEGSA